MNFLRAAVLPGLLETLFGPAAAPQEPADSSIPAGHSLHGEAFNEGPRQKAHLMEGMGNIKFEITTKEPEAQLFFNQGVGQLHGFYYFEAERSFRQAAKLDPGCAMAYWGMAAANVNNEKRAKGFLEKGEKLKAAASKREQLWIQTLLDYYRIPAADKEKRARSYVKSLENIVHEYPDDVEAKAFLAWALWHHKDKGLPMNSHQAVDSIVAEVLRANPMHPGAHHYRIHLWDDEKPARALGSAELFGPSAPGIAHAWHMPGHTYSKLHRYAEAARQQEASARADHAHMIKDSTLPYQIHNFAHNNQWLITDLGYIGRVKDGVALSENLTEIPRHPKHNKVEEGGSCVRLGRTRLMEILVKWEMWDDLIARADGLLRKIEVQEDQVLRLRSLGAAYLATGKIEQGNDCIAQLEALVKAETEKPAPEDLKKKDEAEKSRESRLKPVRNALAELSGRRAEAEGDSNAALEQFLKCDDLRKEVLAQAYLRAGEKDKAEKTAKSAVDAAKGQLYPLAAYVEILYQLEKKKAAKAAHRELEELAVFADPDLPILKRLETSSGRRLPSKTWPDLSNLGPLLWKPSSAPFWSLADFHGNAFSLERCVDNPILVIFYLGSRCKHCVQQLGKFTELAEEFGKAAITVVAVSTETPEEIKKACEGGSKTAAPFPLLADPDKRIFKMYRCWDDFEDIPLHGTFLVDAKEPGPGPSTPLRAGRIRWQEISYEPFMEAKFLLEECRRLLALR